MTRTAAVGAVLLGAGFARRFGSDKRVHLIDGITIAEHTVALYAQVFSVLRVVLRPGDRELAVRLAPFAPQIIVAENAHLGMGHSLAAGFEGLDWDWAFLGLIDMPFTKPATLRLLRDCAHERTRPGIICPTLGCSTDGRYGHPIGWHHSYFPELRQMHGDTGARDLLSDHAADVVTVEVDDEGIFTDIDTRADVP